MKAFKNGEKFPMEKEHLNNLLFRIREHDKDAFSELYEQMKGCVYGIALLYSRSHADAEDIMQNTFIQVWNKAHLYSGKNAKSWIMTIARNLSHNFMKQNSKNAELPEEIPAPDCFSDIYDSEYIKYLFSCLREDEREIIVLSSYGFSHLEISKIVRCPYSTVRWKYSNAVKKILKKTGGADNE